MSVVTLKGKKGIITFNPEKDFVAEGGTGRLFKGNFSPYQDESKEIHSFSSTKIAVKVLFDDMLTKHVVALTKRTAEIEVNHPNLMKLIDFIEQDGIYHTICEWLEGETLEEHIEKNGAIAPDYAIVIINAVLDGLKALHENTPQIIHRDITPANIMICENGMVKIIDLGIAKVIDSDRKSKTEMGSFLGNLYYTPPEQIDGFQSMINPTTDIYALGITFYEMLCGSPPFDQPDLKYKHIEDPIPANSLISNELFKIITKATNKRQSNRFKDAIEFKTAILELQKSSSPKNLPIKFLLKVAAFVIFATFIAVASYTSFKNYNTRTQKSIVDDNTLKKDTLYGSKQTIDNKTNLDKKLPNHNQENNTTKKSDNSSITDIPKITPPKKTIVKPPPKKKTIVAERPKTAFKPKKLTKREKELRVIERAKLKYDRVQDKFRNNRLGVIRNGKCGYIDTQGKEVIPLIYTTCFPFSEGKAGVFSHTKGFSIDVNGKRLVD